MACTETGGHGGPQPRWTGQRHNRLFAGRCSNAPGPASRDATCQRRLATGKHTPLPRPTVAHRDEVTPFS